MDLTIRDKDVSAEDLESNIRSSLDEGLPVNWELFYQITDKKEIYKPVIDLFLHLNILSLKQEGNIVLRFPLATSNQNIGNPRHYSSNAAEGGIRGHDALFFVRDVDATEYIRIGEEERMLVKGYQAQRIQVIEQIPYF